MILKILLIIFSAIFVLLLPGFMLSYVFFDRGKIDAIERLALSVALSISIVPLVVFYTNLLGVKITRHSVIIEILGIMLVTGIILIAKRKLINHH